MTTRTTALALSWLLLAFACSGRLAFDTHFVEGTESDEPTDEPNAAGGGGASPGSETGGNGAAPSGAGDSNGGAAGTDCGGSASTDGEGSEGGADADEPHGTEPDSDDLPRSEHEHRRRCE